MLRFPVHGFTRIESIVVIVSVNLLMIINRIAHLYDTLRGWDIKGWGQKSRREERNFLGES